MSNIAAFFDIDGTLYREGLITEIFKKLIKSEIIDKQRWYNEVREKYIKWDKRIGNYDDYLLKMAEIYTDAIKGLHKTQIEFIAGKVIEQKGDRVYTYTRNRIKWHTDQGHKVITVSGSPYELVSAMSKKHGFNDFMGSIYLTDKNNIYTGEVNPMWDSKNKKEAINHLVEKYDIDLSKSYAYGDTAGDFSMLKSVANPIAINPTKELVAKLKNDPNTCTKAKIIVERKDMVYRLSPCDIIFENNN
ncbi:haloacid dehalogenase [Vallitalea longa]|uniref:phosphoserine phosphatase n=1 Tax=Vallitalea longa TaxID=2936439 RepID=A0A9W5YCN9_9FIRM|nr:HAD-IB family hydrolase [Vallitalea longa]GKX29933.1 haloacid dehalogenase [Vallitalea longa]